MCVQCRKASSCHQGAGWIFFLVPPRSLGLYPVGPEEADEEESSHPVTHVVCHNRNAGLQRLLWDTLLSHNTCVLMWQMEFCLPEPFPRFEHWTEAHPSACERSTWSCESEYAGENAKVVVRRDPDNLEASKTSSCLCLNSADSSGDRNQSTFVPRKRLKMAQEVTPG